MAQNLSWQINPVTGDYVMDSHGKPVVSTDLKTPAYFRLSVPRTKWLYAPDSDYGSDFYLFNRRHVGQDALSAETVAQRALQPMIDDGRASAVALTINAQTRSEISLNLNIVDAQGTPSVIPLDQIGT